MLKSRHSLATLAATGLAVCVLALPATVHAENADDGSVVQKVGHGEINWTKKTVTATGSGAANLKDGPVAVARLNAERAAKLDALRNILETLQGVQIDGKRNVGDMMSNGTIKSKVQGMAQGFKVVDTRYYSDGSVDVVVQMPIDDNLTSALNVSPAKAKDKAPAGGAATFSGLIINAKGLGVLPSISPKVLDEKGKEVYGASVVSEKGLQQGGIAAYESDVETAKSPERVGDKPLIVKALRLKEKTKTDLVISNADAEKLREKGLDLSFLADGKVVIVVD
jgi:hypothetical protein